MLVDENLNHQHGSRNQKYRRNGRYGRVNVLNHIIDLTLEVAGSNTQRHGKGKRRKSRQQPDRKGRADALYRTVQHVVARGTRSERMPHGPDEHQNAAQENSQQPNQNGRPPRIASCRHGKHRPSKAFPSHTGGNRADQKPCCQDPDGSGHHSHLNLSKKRLQRLVFIDAFPRSLEFGVYALGAIFGHHGRLIKVVKRKRSRVASFAPGDLFTHQCVQKRHGFGVPSGNGCTVGCGQSTAIVHTIG